MKTFLQNLRSRTPPISSTLSNELTNILKNNSLPIDSILDVIIYCFELQSGHHFELHCVKELMNIVRMCCGYCTTPTNRWKDIGGLIMQFVDEKRMTFIQSIFQVCKQYQSEGDVQKVIFDLIAKLSSSHVDIKSLLSNSRDCHQCLVNVIRHHLPMKDLMTSILIFTWSVTVNNTSSQQLFGDTDGCFEVLVHALKQSDMTNSIDVLEKLSLVVWTLTSCEDNINKFLQINNSCVLLSELLTKYYQHNKLAGYILGIISAIMEHIPSNRNFFLNINDIHNIINAILINNSKNSAVVIKQACRTVTFLSKDSPQFKEHMISITSNGSFFIKLLLEYKANAEVVRAIVKTLTMLCTNNTDGRNKVCDSFTDDTWTLLVILLTETYLRNDEVIVSLCELMIALVKEHTKYIVALNDGNKSKWQAKVKHIFELHITREQVWNGIFSLFDQYANDEMILQEIPDERESYLYSLYHALFLLQTHTHLYTYLSTILRLIYEFSGEGRIVFVHSNAHKLNDIDRCILTLFQILPGINKDDVLTMQWCYSLAHLIAMDYTYYVCTKLLPQFFQHLLSLLQLRLHNSILPLNKHCIDAICFLLQGLACSCEETKVVLSNTSRCCEVLAELLMRCNSNNIKDKSLVLNVIFSTCYQTRCFVNQYVVIPGFAHAMISAMKDHQDEYELILKFATMLTEAYSPNNGIQLNDDVSWGFSNALGSCELVIDILWKYRNDESVVRSYLALLQVYCVDGDYGCQHFRRLPKFYEAIFFIFSEYCLKKWVTTKTIMIAATVSILRMITSLDTDNIRLYDPCYDIRNRDNVEALIQTNRPIPFTFLGRDKFIILLNVWETHYAMVTEMVVCVIICIQQWHRTNIVDMYDHPRWSKLLYDTARDLHIKKDTSDNVDNIWFIICSIVSYSCAETVQLFQQPDFGKLYVKELRRLNDHEKILLYMTQFSFPNKACIEAMFKHNTSELVFQLWIDLIVKHQANVIVCRQILNMFLQILEHYEPAYKSSVVVGGGLSTLLLPMKLFPLDDDIMLYTSSIIHSLSNDSSKLLGLVNALTDIHPVIVLELIPHSRLTTISLKALACHLKIWHGLLDGTNNNMTLLITTPGYVNLIIDMICNFSTINSSQAHAINTGQYLVALLSRITSELIGDPTLMAQLDINRVRPIYDIFVDLMKQLLPMSTIAIEIYLQAICNLTAPPSFVLLPTVNQAQHIVPFVLTFLKERCITYADSEDFKTNICRLITNLSFHSELFSVLAESSIAYFDLFYYNIVISLPLNDVSVCRRTSKLICRFLCAVYTNKVRDNNCNQLYQDIFEVNSKGYDRICWSLNHATDIEDIETACQLLNKSKCYVHITSEYIPHCVNALIKGLQLAITDKKVVLQIFVLLRDMIDAVPLPSLPTNVIVTEINKFMSQHTTNNMLNNGLIAVIYRWILKVKATNGDYGDCFDQLSLDWITAIYDMHTKASKSQDSLDLLFEFCCYLKTLSTQEKRIKTILDCCGTAGWFGVLSILVSNLSHGLSSEKSEPILSCIITHWILLDSRRGDYNEYWRSFYKIVVFSNYARFVSLASEERLLTLTIPTLVHCNRWIMNVYLDRRNCNDPDCVNHTYCPTLEQIKSLIDVEQYKALLYLLRDCYDNAIEPNASTSDLKALSAMMQYFATLYSLHDRFDLDTDLLDTEAVAVTIFRSMNSNIANNTTIESMMPLACEMVSYYLLSYPTTLPSTLDALLNILENKKQLVSTSDQALFASMACIEKLVGTFLPTSYQFKSKPIVLKRSFDVAVDLLSHPKADFSSLSSLIVMFYAEVIPKELRDYVDEKRSAIIETFLITLKEQGNDICMNASRSLCKAICTIGISNKALEDDNMRLLISSTFDVVQELMEANISDVVFGPSYVQLFAYAVMAADSIDIRYYNLLCLVLQQDSDILSQCLEDLINVQNKLLSCNIVGVNEVAVLLKAWVNQIIAMDDMNEKTYSLLLGIIRALVMRLSSLSEVMLDSTGLVDVYCRLLASFSEKVHRFGDTTILCFLNAVYIFKNVLNSRRIICADHLNVDSLIHILEKVCHKSEIMHMLFKLMQIQPMEITTETSIVKMVISNLSKATKDDSLLLSVEWMLKMIIVVTKPEIDLPNLLTMSSLVIFRDISNRFSFNEEIPLLVCKVVALLLSVDESEIDSDCLIILHEILADIHKHMKLLDKFQYMEEVWLKCMTKLQTLTDDETLISQFESTLRLVNVNQISSKDDHVDVTTHTTAQSDSSFAEAFSALSLLSIPEGDIVIEPKLLDINVYLSTWKNSTMVAIKINRSKKTLADTAILTEVTNLLTLRHPRIIALLGIIKDLRLPGHEDIYTGLVMEYMSKGNLRLVLNNEHGIMSWASKLQIAVDISDAMRFLHESKIVHRSLISDNVLIDNDNRAKLTGFGKELRTNDLVQGISENVVSFGTLLWELITGKVITNPEGTSHKGKKGKQPSSNKLSLTQEEEKFCGSVIVSLLERCLTKKVSFAEMYETLHTLQLQETKRFTDHLQSIPDGFICCITQDVMKDPVMLLDGHTYERAAIQAWFGQGKNRSPKTNQIITDTTIMIENYALKSAIEEFMKHSAANALRKK